MDDDEVARLCAAAATRIEDARSHLVASAKVEWTGTTATAFHDAVDELVADLARASRQLERARGLLATAWTEKVQRGGALTVEGGVCGGAAWGG